MKITKLTYENLKGRSKEFSFSTCNLIVGKNFEGKSSVFDAIRLAMLGYVPGNPPLNTNQAIFQLASGPSMSALVETDSPATWKAEYVRVKQSIKETCFPFVTDAPTQMLLDPYLYFGPKVTGSQRINLACELLSGAVDFSTERIMSQLKACPVERTPHAEKIIQRVTNHVQMLLGPYCEDGPQSPMATVLADLDDWLKEQESDANKVAKRMQMTVEGLSDLASIAGAMEQLPSEESLDARQAARDKKAAEVNQAIGTAQAAQNDFARRRQERERLSQRRAAVATLPDKEAELFRLKKAANKALEEEAGLRVQLANLTEQIALANGEADRLEAAAAKLRESAKGEEKWIPLHSEEAEKFALASGWQGIWKKLVKLIQDKLNIKTAIFCQVKKEPDHNAEELADTYEAQACNARDNADNEEVERQKIYFQIGNYERSAALNARTLAVLEAQFASLQKERENLQYVSVDEENAAPVDIIPDLRAQIAELNQEAAQDRQVRQRIANLRADKTRTEQAAAEKANVAVELEILKFMRSRVKSLREALVDESMEKALSVANRFCVGILQGTLAYYDGEVGKSTARGFVPYATFSGSEKTLATLALSVALASRSEIKIVLLDELANFSEENALIMLTNLAGLVADKTISQFIAISPRKADAGLAVIEGLNVIHF